MGKASRRIEMGLLSPPLGVLEIARRLEDAGFETWCVGGAVRDALLGQAHLDWDLATAATPDQVQALFKRTKPVGIEFGTVGVLDRAGIMHEVTTFRRDIRTDGRHAVVEFGASLDEDLARRDFTVNAMAYSPSSGKLHDPFGGRADLEGRRIRAVGIAEDRMREDRLRALRAIRFAARFGFAIDDETWWAIVSSAPHLGRLSAERVQQEIEKTMDQVAAPGLAFGLWQRSGALEALVPALAPLSPIALATLDRIPMPTARHPERRMSRLVALFLDVGERDAAKTARALRFSNSDAEWIGAIAGRWAELGPEMTASITAEKGPGDAQIRRWVASVGRSRITGFLRVAAARWSAMREGAAPHVPAARVQGLYRRAVRSAFRDPVELRDLAVDGNDLVDAGIPPGPMVGKILRALLDRVVEDPALNRRDPLLSAAVGMHAQALSEDEDR
jgi:tRNA nucleotidyltransferase (CCA-adding enzyme)